MADVGPLVKPARQKEAGLVFVLAPRKVTLTVQDLQELKNVKTRRAQIHSLEESGNVVAKNRGLNNE